MLFIFTINALQDSERHGNHASKPGMPLVLELAFHGLTCRILAFSI
jgi:hypothetical protein